MPQSERPSSPEEQNSDQFNMYRLEHELYELFEEQQMLLDIVSQQQERLERQLEVQRLLMSEPPARMATPLPELLLEEINDELPVCLETQPEPDLLDTVEEEQEQLASTLCLCAQIRRQQQQQQGQEPQHQVGTLLSQGKSKTGGKCSPPKMSGLGYDSPFPYPKHLSKGRNRRALCKCSMVPEFYYLIQFFF